MLKHPHVRIGKPTVTGNLSAGQFPSRAEAKVHLRVDFDDDDTYIDSILDSTLSYIEDYCGVKFGSKVQYDAYWDYAYPEVMVHWNGDSVSTTGQNAPVLYQLVDGAYVAMDATTYTLDYVTSPLRVLMKSSGTTTAAELNQYKLTFNVATQSIPHYVFQAALMIIGHYYENRQDVGKERIFEVPMNSRYLLDRYRKQVFT
jgi:uncharacterized phiE125 gp8 family phage protein